MKLSQARNIAEKLVYQLAPACSKIEIAGSIRREREDVKDIEIVCLPKLVQSGGDLFDLLPPTLVRSQAFIKAAYNLGQILGGGTSDRYMKVLITDTFSKINLDLFIPEEYDYIRQLAIRTGSSEYSHTKIAVAWNRKGWVGTANGLRLFLECIDINKERSFQDGIKRKPKWKCIKIVPTLPPVWKTEQEFFAWLEIPYVEPKFRNE